MAISNFWHMLIWLLLATMIMSVMNSRYMITSYSMKEQRWKKDYAFILFLPFIIWAGFRTTAYGDTAAYIRMFNDAPSELGQLIAYTIDQTKDKGYTVFTILFKSLFGESHVLFFLLIAFIQGLALVYIYHKYSCDYALSIALFVLSTDYIGWMHNGTRQFLAVTIVFACFPLILEKKYGKAILITLLAATIHATALLVIPFFFVAQGEPWNKKTLLFLVGVILSITFLDEFTGMVTTVMENTQYSAEVEDFLSDDGVNYLRVLVYSVPAIMSLAFKKRIRRYNNPIINYSINMSIVASGLYVIGMFTSGIMFGRLPIAFALYNYISLPWIISAVFTDKSAKIIKGICLCLYFVFFYYQMHFSWGLI